MIRAALMPLLAALGLLTRVPIAAQPSAAQLRAAPACFPLVGLLLGGLLALLAAPLAERFGALLAGALLVSVHALMSGGLHLDGVADVFDAAGGGRGDRARALSIMRDPRIGAHGAAALCLLLCTKLLAFGACSARMPAVGWVLLPAVARGLVVSLLWWLPPARADGLAHATRPVGALPWLFATGCSALAIAALWPPGWVPLAGAAVAVSGVGLWSRSRLGGVTGDVCGAAIELAELSFALAVLAMLGGPPS